MCMCVYTPNGEVCTLLITKHNIVYMHVLVNNMIEPRDYFSCKSKYYKLLIGPKTWVRNTYKNM